MKVSHVRPGLIPLVLTLACAAVLPVQAARFRRGAVFQNQVFQVASDARIVVGTNRTASLANVRIGDRVGISYAQENGVWVIHRLADGVPHNAPHPGTKPAPTQHPRPKAPALFHAHGVVRGVDLQAGTLLIACRVR